MDDEWQEYLGDGLYAKFENMQVVLMANDQSIPQTRYTWNGPMSTTHW